MIKLILKLHNYTAYNKLNAYFYLRITLLDEILQEILISNSLLETIIASKLCEMVQSYTTRNYNTIHIS